MDECIKRKPFQGVCNIMRFNKHFFITALCLIVLLFIAIQSTTGFWNDISKVLFFGILLVNLSSLSISYYIYDLSGFYEMSLLKELDINSTETFVNINAGFDETSALLKQHLSPKVLHVLDFYDAQKHTEYSIKIARVAYPPYPGTQKINSHSFDLPSGVADKIFAIFALHEIRNEEERIACFLEIKRVLKQNGKLILIEHLRNPINFLAYNIGFLHFFSHKSWIKTIKASGMHVLETRKITPFLCMYIIGNHGNSY